TRPSSDSPSRTPTGTQLWARASISTTETKWKRNARPPTWTHVLFHRGFWNRTVGNAAMPAPAYKTTATLSQTKYIPIFTLDCNPTVYCDANHPRVDLQES